mgnify:CR=1 FL=1
MKKTLTIIMLLLLSSLVIAQDTERITNSDDAGMIGPNSIFYKADVFFDEQSVTGTLEEQADARIKIANERLAELETFPTSERPIAELNKQWEKIHQLNVSQRVLTNFQKHLSVLERVQAKLMEKGVPAVTKGLQKRYR